MSNKFEQISLKPGFMEHNGIPLEMYLKQNMNLNQ